MLPLHRRFWCALVLLLAACGNNSGGNGNPNTGDRCANVTCTASDECHVAGTCDAATGACSNPAAPEGKACTGGTCTAGVCVAPAGLCAGVVCAALDACHPAGVCDPATGACVSGPAADGTACSGSTCSGGVCVAAGGTCTDGAKNAAETDVDCGGGLCQGCVDGKACAADGDCMSGHCASGHCALLVTALVADPGPARAVAPNVHVVLDGTRSRSPAGPIATWSWAQSAGPAVTLTGADTAHPSFDAPSAGEAVLAFTLTVGDGAATASAPLEISVRAADQPAENTSLGLILDAMSDGRLDRETAATYLAFSAHGDARLPAEYRGTERAPSGTAAMHIVADEFPTLSPAAQEVVRPFLLPPASPESWAAHEVTPGLREPAAVITSQGWIGISGKHLVIWYRPSLVNGQSIASSLLIEAETKIWTDLKDVFTEAHMPVLNDAGINLVNGGTHGKLNVYLVAVGANGPYGEELAYGTAPAPSFINLDQSLPFSGKPMGLSESLAHEMTHSCQDSFKQKETYQGHRWIYEGTAAWAQDYVYPSTNTEHQYAPWYLNWPYISIDDDWSLHPYGTYLFFQSVTRPLTDNAFIRRIFENFQNQPALEAVENALPNDLGYQIYWRGFVAAEWNRDPTKDFWGVDALDRGAKPRPLPVEIKMEGGGSLAHDMEIKVRHVAANYVNFTFPDPTARQIFFYDGYMFKLAMTHLESGQLITDSPDWQPDQLRWPFMSTAVHVKRGAGWERKLPPGTGGMLVCQDDPRDRIQELAIGFGYGFPVKGESMAPQGLQPRLWVSNIGCYLWAGTVTGSKSPSADGPSERTTAQVTWVRDASYMPLPGPDFSVGEGSSFTWEMSGTWNECIYSGSDAWTGSGAQEGGLSFLPQFVTGPASRGYSGSGGGRLVKYRVSCPEKPVAEYEKQVFWLDTTREADKGWFPQVSADGLNAVGTADNGQMVYTWDFFSTPGP